MQSCARSKDNKKSILQCQIEEVWAIVELVEVTKPLLFIFKMDEIPPVKISGRPKDSNSFH